MTKTKVSMDDNAFDRFYKRFRSQANRSLASHFGVKTADTVICVPDLAYLLCKLMGDPDVPTGRKLDFLISVLYIASPFDLFHDSIPVIGILDDIYVSVLSVSKMIRSVDRQVLMRYWLSDPRVLDNVRSWLQFIDLKFGSGLLKNIVSYVKS